jgi:hypothetical protein
LGGEADVKCREAGSERATCEPHRGKDCEELYKRMKGESGEAVDGWQKDHVGNEEVCPLITVSAGARDLRSQKQRAVRRSDQRVESRSKQIPGPCFTQESYLPRQLVALASVVAASSTRFQKGEKFIGFVVSPFFSMTKAFVACTSRNRGVIHL